MFGLQSVTTPVVLHVSEAPGKKAEDPNNETPRTIIVAYMHDGVPRILCHRRAARGVCAQLRYKLAGRRIVILQIARAALQECVNTLHESSASDRDVQATQAENDTASR